MKLTKFQYRALKLYWHYHTTGFTGAQVLKATSKQWLILIVCVALSYFFLIPASLALGCLAIGMFCGAILRDIGHYQVAFRLWPINREIYDWKKVSEFIELHEKAPQ